MAPIWHSRFSTSDLKMSNHDVSTGCCRCCRSRYPDTRVTFRDKKKRLGRMDPYTILWTSYLKTCDVLFLICARTPAVSLALACLQMSGWHVGGWVSQERMFVLNNPSGARRCWGAVLSQCSVLNARGQIYTAAGHVLANICWSRTVVGEDAATTQAADLPRRLGCPGFQHSFAADLSLNFISRFA